MLCSSSLYLTQIEIESPYHSLQVFYKPILYLYELLCIPLAFLFSAVIILLFSLALKQSKLAVISECLHLLCPLSGTFFSRQSHRPFLHFLHPYEVPTTDRLCMTLYKLALKFYSCPSFFFFTVLLTDSSLLHSYTQKSGLLLYY